MASGSIPMTMVTLESLRPFVHHVLRAMGLPEEEAEIFGGALVFSELRFHPGHGQGVKKLRRYSGRFTEGLGSSTWPPPSRS
jgi:LDH2 family malate/lactate/ureidoglycolate dehydrogenase